MPTDEERIIAVLERRLPAAGNAERKKLAKAYLDGVSAHAVERTTGSGSVPTNLGSERAEILAFASRGMGRLLTEDEISALLRITGSASKSVSKTMLATFDDLPLLSLKAAFVGASRDGRGTAGDITNGYRVKFARVEKMELARVELERRGLMCETAESTGSRHVLLIDPQFNIDEILPE